MTSQPESSKTGQPESSKTGQPKSSKKGLTFGLTAGLIGGTAAGMVFGVPGLSGATGSDAATVGIVAQVDDTGTPDATVTPDADVAADDAVRPEPGTRLRESLQDLVDDGTITAEQADAVTTHLVENRAERGDFGRRGGGPGRFGSGEFSTVVTDLLGIDAETLRGELRDGSTLAEVATAHGVDTQTLIDTMVAAAEARLAEAVDSGNVDADRAAEMSADIEQRFTDIVNGEGGGFGRHRGPGRGGPFADATD